MMSILSDSTPSSSLAGRTTRRALGCTIDSRVRQMRPSRFQNRDSRQSLTSLTSAQFSGQMVVRMLVDGEPIIGARQHGPQKLLGVRGFQRIAVGPERTGLLHLFFGAYTGHH